MIVIFYATGFLATFFGLKFHRNYKDATWENLNDRLFCACVFPLTALWIAINFAITHKSNNEIKPPKWL